MSESVKATKPGEQVGLSNDFYIRQKRSHKKSRNGCLTCKQRRVKCDERVPCCKVCTSRGIECTYAESHKGSPVSRRGSPGGIAAPLSETLRWEAVGEVDDLALRPAYRQTPDKLLFHYYLNHVGGTFASIHNDPGLARMWQTGVPSVAFAYRGVAHAIMAVSALCMGSTEEHAALSTYDHQGTSEFHYSQAVKHLRKSMEALDQTNIDAILACCMVLVPYSLGIARVAKEAALVGDWLTHIRGFVTLGDRLTGSDSYTDTTPSPPSPDQLVIYPQPSNPGLDMAVSSSTDLLPKSSPALLLQSIRESGRGAMENLRRNMDPQCSKLSADDVQACLGALNGLDTIFDYALQGRATNYHRAVLHWLIVLPSRFVSLLFEEADAALAIFAYWLVSTVVMEDLWWMKGFGASRIRIIANGFERSRGAYQACIEWPLEMLKRLNAYG